MITIEESREPDVDWNNRLLKAGVGPMVQTKERGENYARDGENPHFLKFVDNKGEIVGQILLGVISRFSAYKSQKIITKIPGVKKFTYFWIYGPIIFDTNLTKDIFLSFSNYLLSKKSRVYGTTYPLCPFEKNVMSTNFKIQEWATNIIDLQKPLDELYSNIHKHSGRKNIERAEKKGVTVEEINEKNLPDYHKIRHQFKERLGEETFDYEITLKWWKLVKPIGYSGILARKDQKPIGGILFSHFNDVIVEAGVARSEEDAKEKLYAQDLIKWKIIEWGHNKKMKFYDLAGYNPYPKTSKEEGIKRYKEKWGGKKFPYWFVKK